MNKKWFLACLAVFVGSSILVTRGSQPARPGMPDIAAQKQAMQKLAPFVGKWKGDASIQMGPERRKLTQTEVAAFGLDGLILKIDGLGIVPDAPADAPPAYQAFGVINYNDQVGKYEFRAFARGFAHTFDFDVRDDGTFVWQVDVPGNVTRYTIKIDADTWQEAGERSTDGKIFQPPFLEMNLTRVKG